MIWGILLIVAAVILHVLNWLCAVMTGMESERSPRETATSLALMAIGLLFWVLALLCSYYGVVTLWH